MDFGIIAIIGVVVVIIASAIWLALRDRRTRTQPGDPHVALYSGDRANADAMGRALAVDAARDSGSGAF